MPEIQTNKDLFNLTVKFVELKAGYLAIAEQYHMICHIFQPTRHTEMFDNCKEQTCEASKQFFLNVQA